MTVHRGLKSRGACIDIRLALTPEQIDDRDVFRHDAALLYRVLKTQLPSSTYLQLLALMNDDAVPATAPEEAACPRV